MRQVTKLVCTICGQEISASNMSKHLRRHENHPETFGKSVYKLNHEGLDCQYCGKQCKNRNSLCNHERLCKENPNRQNTIIVGFNNKGRTGWNKGLTKDTDERVLKYTMTLRQHLQDGLIKTLKGNDNPASRPEVKEKISKTCLEKSAKGEWHTSLAKQHHYEYKGMDLHCAWELEFAKFLDAKGINYTRCKERFPYLFDNKTHYYTPDFYIVDYDIFIEIKGYKTEKDVCKWSQFPKEKKLHVLFGNDLLALGLNISI